MTWGTQQIFNKTSHLEKGEIGSLPHATLHNEIHSRLVKYLYLCLYLYLYLYYIYIYTSSPSLVACVHFLPIYPLFQSHPGPSISDFGEILCCKLGWLFPPSWLLCTRFLGRAMACCCAGHALCSVPEKAFTLESE